MKFPRSSIRGSLSYVVLMMAVLVLLCLSREWHMAKDAMLAGGKHICQDIAVSLLESTTRAPLILVGIVLAALYVFGRAIALRIP